MIQVLYNHTFIPSVNDHIIQKQAKTLSTNNRKKENIQSK